ncbi:hypothetical protein LJY25_17280 [Hymenobacter sp. BT175]|uniref:hypothetical protein n=1 Tax=Hymenobacter translucens TaxID=2886507 RepID=UPI001D0E2A17|nr:hypothetical protein [Hymenobacter translucens]MCC2548206.1 hypothetical protein [Hymenobacter translucens]
MKNVAALALLLALATPVAAAKKSPALRVLDQRNGFRTAKLGSDIRSFRYLTPERSDASTQTTYYINTRENLRMGAYKVTGISYGFYKDKLCSIEVRVMGDVNCRGIHDLLVSDYGPSQRLPQVKSEQWEGQQVTLRYTEVPQGFATVTVTSNALTEQRLAERKAPGSYPSA